MSDTEYTADVNVTEDITPDVDGGDATSSAVDMDDILLSADISPDELVDVELYSDEPINTDVRDTVGSSETDHRLLTHRDAPDQHPITAITGLNTSLQNMAASIDSRLTADENGIILLQVETDGHTQRLNVVEGDVVDAAKTATNYVTALSPTGIKLHAEDSASLNYMTLDGTDGLKMYKSGTNTAVFTDSSARVGAENSSHMNITASGLEVFTGAESASTSAATFGDVTRIGYEDSANITIDAHGIEGISANGTQYFTVTEGATGVINKYEPFSNEYMGVGGSGYYLEDYSIFHAESSVIADYYTALPNGNTFIIRLNYFARRTDTTTQEERIVRYATKDYTFTKYAYGSAQWIDGELEYYPRDASGTLGTPARIRRLSGHPSFPSVSGYTFEEYGAKVYCVIPTTGGRPFYRFGVDVAETGGAASFVMGVGTEAGYESQLALGTYNQSTTELLLMVGNGTSASARSNALTLSKDGDLTIAGTLTQASDRRLKEHISYLGEDAVDFVRALKPAHFIKSDKHHTGFYAQEVEAADEWHCMTGEMNGFKTLGYTELIAPLVAYCQSLEARIEELERK